MGLPPSEVPGNSPSEVPGDTPAEGPPDTPQENPAEFPPETEPATPTELPPGQLQPELMAVWQRAGAPMTIINAPIATGFLPFATSRGRDAS
ncbi:hypothetical protein [Cypionkella sp.]|uniref:hypothetical protein n=1 Tax=Cypionkella sp. TaxID=2811411 RepID=UPI00271618D6|nr:hypothetical protein [Cypionkella sp.]MDO8986202.1 hypothetical protein [Cypionkella sp.]MDP2050386.1 hypothetical protein [Cypionkella sp.]